MIFWLPRLRKKTNPREEENRRLKMNEMGITARRPTRNQHDGPNQGCDTMVGIRTDISYLNCDIAVFGQLSELSEGI